MSSSAEQSIAGWVSALAARQPTPGGGGAAAIAAAIGAAAGAMSARYTTGKRWEDRAEQAEALATQLDQVAADCLALADEDAAAYLALQASWKATDMDASEREAIAGRALAVPLRLVATCAEAADLLVAFLTSCNPQIVSDAKVGIHLLAGAGRAGWQTLLVNQPDATTRAQAEQALATLAASERTALG